jgi:hypothetical protein
MNLSLSQIAFGVVLMFIQVFAALPWVLAFNWTTLRAQFANLTGSARTARAAPGGILLLLVIALTVLVGLGGIVPALILGVVQDRDTLEGIGRAYGALLQLQLGADIFVVAFALLLWVWPKGGAVALAAFREGVRQPMFVLLLIAGIGFMALAPFLPYFTFGEDHKMVEEIGYDSIMLAALIFGTLLSSMSISDEIEGRTAITLMSKPVSRRQFLIGKFIGILLASFLITVILGWWFDWVLLYKRWYDRLDPVEVVTPLTTLVRSWLPASSDAPTLFRGIELWAMDAAIYLPGLILGFCQVMVLLAVAVSLATRLPMVVNLVICLAIYFGGHLTPVLVQIAQNSGSDPTGVPISRVLVFMAQLFDTILPGLDFFSPVAVVRDNPLPTLPFLQYIGSVVLYAVLYTLIVLVAGLILFEDRDLA